jgi:hypothetical protein
MSVDPYHPHILILPEDRANRELANGFMRESWARPRQIYVEPEAGGWLVAVRKFNSDYAKEMRTYPGRHVILLVDFDGRAGRLDDVKTQVPALLSDRVFVIGAWTTPEDLKGAIGGTYGSIGEALARECLAGTRVKWNDKQLQHNLAELNRLCARPELQQILS